MLILIKFFYITYFSSEVFLIIHSSIVSPTSIHMELTAKSIDNLMTILKLSSIYGSPRSLALDFFRLQRQYSMQVEKDYDSRGETTINFYFELEANPTFHLVFPKKTIRLKTVIKPDCFLLIAVQEVDRSFAQPNSRRLPMEFKFLFYQNRTKQLSLDENVLAQIQNLPVAREQSKIVQQRLKSWEIYLDLLNQNALNNELTLDYIMAQPSKNFRELYVTVQYLRENIEQHNIIHFNATLLYVTETGQTEEEKVGTIKRAVPSKNLLVIELEDDYVELLRMNKWAAPIMGQIKLYNFGDLSQARNLRKGFHDLRKGHAQNPNLEYLIFDEEPITSSSWHTKEIAFQDTLRDNLNSFQRDAVLGALKAQDLFLIQGPPGTGKTTVIAEICYQNAIRGLRTLVASQSHLAVDNALSKLLEHPSIRILRKGRTSSIEEEGKKYIEENIAQTWKNQTYQLVENDLTLFKDEAQVRINEVEALKRDIKQQEALLVQIDELALMKQEEALLKKNLAAITERLDTEQSALRLLSEKVQVKEHQLLQLVDQREATREQLHQLNDEKKRQLQLAEYERIEQSLAEDMNRLKRIRDSKVRIEKLKKQLADTSRELKEIQAQQSILQSLTPSTSIKRLAKFLNDSTVSIPNAMYETERKIRELRILLNKESVPIDQIDEWISTIRMLQERLLPTLQTFDVHPDRSFDLIEPATEKWNQQQYEVFLRKIRSHLIDWKDPNWLEQIQFKLTKKYPASIQQSIAYYHELSSHLKALMRMIKSQQRKDKQQQQYQLMCTEHEQNVRAMIDTIILFKNQDVASAEKKVRLAQDAFSHLQDVHEKDSRLVRTDVTIKDLQRESLQNYKNKKLLLDVVHTKENYQKELMTLEQKITLAENDKSMLLAKMDKMNHKIQHLKEQHALARQTYKTKLFETQSAAATIGKITAVQLRQHITEATEQITASSQSIKEWEDLIEMKEVWKGLLETAENEDLEEIRQLYIRHANVIGTTCLQSARPDFIKDYPDFDVVIIDEVSKATPPELLIPMLKGKKIILVGDHRQLPPLIGDETIEEAVSALPLSQQEEAKEILQESLFERLFETLPPENKQTLRIQYRMHESIMQTITPFYKKDDVPGASGLVCGLQNSDEERDHLLNGQYVQRGQHLMWFDLPNEKEFFEQKEAGSTSIFNLEELKIVKELILDIEQAVIKAKNEGLMDKHAKKEVGIISFYGEQIRRLKALVDEEIETSHLKFRIGTVDRFQGMESDIIIASFVRNNSQGTIGFLQDYRRLNVALSRAKELLLITGNSATLMKQSRHAAMFKELMRIVQQQNGMRDHLGRFLG